MLVRVLCPHPRTWAKECFRAKVRFPGTLPEQSRRVLRAVGHPSSPAAPKAVCRAWQYLHQVAWPARNQPVPFSVEQPPGVWFEAARRRYLSFKFSFSTGHPLDPETVFSRLGCGSFDRNAHSYRYSTRVPHSVLQRMTRSMMTRQTTRSS